MDKAEDELYKRGFSLTLRNEDGEYWNGVRYSIRFSDNGIEFISNQPNHYVKATADELLAFVNYWKEGW